MLAYAWSVCLSIVSQACSLIPSPKQHANSPTGVSGVTVCMYVCIYIYTLYIICAQTAVLSLWGSVNLSTFTSAFCEVFSLELVNMFSLCLRVYIQCMYIYIYALD